MKKLFLILTLFTTLISCNSSTSIPENSIYKKGDIVYKIDSIIYSEEAIKYSTNKNHPEFALKNEAVDKEFIHRQAITNFIVRDNISGIGGEVDANNYLISDNYIIMIRNKDFKYHISHVVNY